MFYAIVTIGTRTSPGIFTFLTRDSIHEISHIRVLGRCVDAFSLLWLCYIIRCVNADRGDEGVSTLELIFVIKRGGRDIRTNKINTHGSSAITVDVTLFFVEVKLIFSFFFLISTYALGLTSRDRTEIKNEENGGGKRKEERRRNEGTERRLRPVLGHGSRQAGRMSRCTTS